MDVDPKYPCSVLIAFEMNFSSNFNQFVIQTLFIPPNKKTKAIQFEQFKVQWVMDRQRSGVLDIRLVKPNTSLQVLHVDSWQVLSWLKLKTLTSPGSTWHPIHLFLMQ